MLLYILTMTYVKSTSKASPKVIVKYLSAAMTLLFFFILYTAVDYCTLSMSSLLIWTIVL